MNAKKAVATIGIKADPKALERDLAASKKTLRAFGNDVKKITGKVFGGARGALGSIGGGVGLTAAFGIADLAKSALDFEKGMTRFQISSQKGASEMSDFRSAISGVSRETGKSREEVLAAANEYVKLTGDAAGAADGMLMISRVAQATGSSVEDVARSANALRLSGIGLKDMEDAFSAMIVQGRGGSVELNDMAKHLAALLPAFRQFQGGAGMGGLKDMGAAFQVIMGGAGDAGQAASQFSSLMGALGNPEVAKKLKKIGVSVYGANGKMRSFVDIMDDLAKNKLLDKGPTLGGIFGDKEARTAVITLREQINGFHQLRAAAQGSAGAVQAQLDVWRESAGGKFEAALVALNEKVAEVFTPENVVAFADAVGEVASAIGTVIGGLKEIKDHLTGKSVEELNPFEKSGGRLDPDAPWYEQMNGAFNAVAFGSKDPSVLAANKAAWETPEDQRTPEQRKRVREMMSNRMNAKAWSETKSGINSGATREARVRSAVIATMTAPGAEGSTGSVMAGKDWLERNNVSESEKQDAKNKIEAQQTVMKNYIEMLGKRIETALQNGVNVKIGADSVSKAIDNAPTQRSGRK